MRILWISHLLPYPPKGGVLQRSYYLLREAAARFDVHFVGLSQSGHQDSEAEVHRAKEALEDLGVRVDPFRLSADRSSINRFALIARSYLSPRPYDVNWLDQDDVRRHLESLCDKYDLIHVDTLGLTPYTAAFQETPFVLNHHNIESQLTGDRAKDERNFLKGHYLSREASKLQHWERTWCPQAAVNTVVSALDRDRLRRRVGGDDLSVAIVENGVDIDYFEPKMSPDQSDEGLIFVGRLSWFPNRDAATWFAEEIWPALRDDDPARTATIIGQDPPSELRRAADGRSLAAPGFVKDVRPHVDRALAYVCPIRQGGGTRLKILDALAMAKPLVATEFAVEGLNLEEGKHYLRAETPREYVEQIKRLEQSPPLRRRLGEEGRRFVETNYAWSVIGQHLEQAYLTARQVGHSS